MIKEFVYNLKEYFKYLTKVGFKELFLNVLSVILYIIAASFFYIPVGIIEDVIRELIVSFTDMSDLFMSLYNWFFSLVSAIIAIYVFIRLFNRGFNFKENKEPVPIKKFFEEDKKDGKSTKKENIKDDIDLPKTKDE